VPGSALLIRGGTSSVGLAAAVLAKGRGLEVVSTTRSAAKAEQLRAVGVDHVVIDDGEIAGAVRELYPDGVGGAIELVGTTTLYDTLRATARLGTVSFTGMLADDWTVKDFYPIDFIPNGVRLTAYSGEASDLSPRALQDFLDAVSAGRAIVPLGTVYSIDEIATAHADLESGAARGKSVVVLDR
jgi:NADPH:quinone reductase-like Zn-dependent oxidoreductase